MPREYSICKISLGNDEYVYLKVCDKLTFTVPEMKNQKYIYQYDNTPTHKREGETFKVTKDIPLQAAIAGAEADGEGINVFAYSKFKLITMQENGQRDELTAQIVPDDHTETHTTRVYAYDLKKKQKSETKYVDVERIDKATFIVPEQSNQKYVFELGWEDHEKKEYEDLFEPDYSSGGDGEPPVLTDPFQSVIRGESGGYVLISGMIGGLSSYQKETYSIYGPTEPELIPIVDGDLWYWANFVDRGEEIVTPQGEIEEIGFDAVMADSPNMHFKKLGGVYSTDEGWNNIDFVLLLDMSKIKDGFTISVNGGLWQANEAIIDNDGHRRPTVPRPMDALVAIDSFSDAKELTSILQFADSKIRGHTSFDLLGSNKGELRGDLGYKLCNYTSKYPDLHVNAPNWWIDPIGRNQAYAWAKSSSVRIATIKYTAGKWSIT